MAKNIKFKIVKSGFTESSAAHISMVIVFLFSMFFTGCAAQKRLCPPLNSAVDAKNLLNENASKIKPFRATGECTISYLNGKNEKISQSFPLRMWYLNEKKFCFYGDAGFNPQAVSFAINDDKYWVYVKPMNLFVKGDVNPAGKDYFSNPTLIVNFLNPAKDCGNFSLTNNSFVCKDFLGRERAVFVDSCLGVAEKIEYFDADAKHFLVVKAEKYEKVKDGQFLFPNKVFYEYYDASGTNQMDIKFDSVRIWKHTPRQVEALFTPPEMKK